MREPPAIAAVLARLQHPALPVIDLGLERVYRLLERLGNPHLRLPPVIHVAGTNGKGSLIANLHAIFTHAGYRVHRYISPHLVRFSERIVLAGEEIRDEALLALLLEVEEAARVEPVTFFESTTAAAFLAFARMPADVVLLETGMGGRLDATNVLPSPLLTAITPISFDHCEFLGNSLAKIAFEKAGIIKQGVSCVIGAQPPEALEVFEQIARERQSPLFRYGKDWQVTQKNGEVFYTSPAVRIALKPALEGEHQRYNAAMAAACAESVLPAFSLLSPEHITQGIQNALWPARLQRLADHPWQRLLPAGMELWLDGGHNPEGGRILAEWAKTQRTPLHLICGMIKGKDVEGFLTPLADIASALYAISIPEEPNSQPAAHLAEIARKIGIHAVAVSSPEAALPMISGKEGAGNILICGSLYLAGYVMPLCDRVIAHRHA